MADIIDDVQTFQVAVESGVGVYADFTVDDPGGFLDVTENRITATNLPRGSYGGVYRVMGDGYFTQFTHLFQACITETAVSGGVLLPYGIVNDGITTYQDIVSGLKNGIAVGIHLKFDIDVLRIWLRECAESGGYIDIPTTWLNQLLYFTVSRDDTNNILSVFADPSRTQFLGSTTTPITASYSVIQGFMFRGDAGPYQDRVISGYVENLTY